LKNINNIIKGYMLIFLLPLTLSTEVSPGALSTELSSDGALSTVLSRPLSPGASATPPFPPPLFYFAFPFFGADLTGTITSSLLDIIIKAGVTHAPRTVGDERERGWWRREAPMSERVEEASNMIIKILLYS
jgi:hypothetical protein